MLLLAFCGFEALLGVYWLVTASTNPSPSPDPNPNPNPEPDPNPNPNPSPKSNPNQVLKTVDVSYGGENGFNQAIELSSETLTNVKFVQEKKLISKYFEEISQDTGKFCFGIKDTLTALEMGAVQTLQPHTQPQP